MILPALQKNSQIAPRYSSNYSVISGEYNTRRRAGRDRSDGASEDRPQPLNSSLQYLQE